MILTDPVELLLVEDSPYDAELTIRALQEEHVTNQIHWVHDGAEALDFLFGSYADADDAGRQLPRIVLLDLKLPKIDGLEVLRRIKADERTRLIPVVVLTSSREEKDVIESYKLGVNSYIVKPVDFDKFVQAIREIGLYWMLLNNSPSWS